MDRLKRFEEIGFRKVGGWSLKAGEPIFTLDSCGSSKDVLYAFVSGGDVLYVGKTTQTLQRRMYGYQRPGPTQRTNIAGRAHICELLGQQRFIDIYALPDSGILHHGAFQVSLAAGLEDALIRELQPQWNKAGK